MAYRYNVIGDYFGPHSDKVIEQVPAWCIVVIRFKNIVTFDRSQLDGYANSSIAESPDLAAGTRGDPLIISSDCIQITTQTNKGSHLSNMSATLMPGNINYLSEIMPGDWCFAWIANSEQKINDVIDRIKKGQAANRFDDGLKFMGRIQSVRKNGAAERGTGKKVVRYYLQATGFREFDTTIYFDPALQRKYNDIGEWLGRLNEAVSDFIKVGAQKGGLDINLAMPKLLKILLGSGIPSSLAGGGATTIATGLTSTPEAPYAYIVPQQVGNILGRPQGSKPIMSYADCLDFMIGRHRYSNGDRTLDINALDNAKDAFMPDGLDGQSGSYRSTGLDLLGKFLPQVPQFTNKTVWSILSQYLNPAINEMYTCLRVNAQGAVVPTLVVRQLPFSTPKYVDRKGVSDVTPYMELPRWVLEPALVYSYDIGRSNAMRFNFIHVYGQSGMSKYNYSQTEAVIRNPPIRDGLDIKRNGLSADMMAVACSLEDEVLGPKKWMGIRADFQMGLHLTFNGTINTVGISTPICEGDNLEFDGVVYHIESVLHQAGIDAGGRRNFSTCLQVTHGLRADTREEQTKVSDFVNDASMYPGIVPEDQTKLDPGLSYEGYDDVPDGSGVSRSKVVGNEVVAVPQESNNTGITS